MAARLPLVLNGGQTEQLQSGDALNLSSLSTPFAAYSNALTASTTNPTLGSGGSITSYYLALGKLVFFYGQVVFGTSGVNAGSGYYEIVLPVAAKGNLGNLSMGLAEGYHNSTGVVSVATVNILGGAGSTTGVFLVNGTPGLYENNNPWVWAANDTIQFSGFYESQ
jgi:hypothetical protein